MNICRSSGNLQTKKAYTGRKIIHVDMDCFYAAIEVRDRPELKGKPVAVGGSADRRGVLCTCNYEARKFGIHSAMASSRALTLCKDLIILPVDFAKYHAASNAIQLIFQDYTDKIEPLSLDEAYLDVTDCQLFSGSATLIAQDIRQKIFNQLQLTASAGIASNKLLAKIASDWNKPNGQYAVPPDKVDEFIKPLPVKKLFGVGKVTAEKLHGLKIETCGDLQRHSLEELSLNFGKFGFHLYQMSRGIDEREVINQYERKSLSTEETFNVDFKPEQVSDTVLQTLHAELENRLRKHPELLKKIKSITVKIKFSDFSSTTIQQSGQQWTLNQFIRLFRIRAAEQNKPIRLIGFGVHFYSGDELPDPKQLELILNHDFLS